MAALFLSLALQADPAAVKAGLQGVVDGKVDRSKLSVTYDDLHGLHGGLRLTIKGDGSVSREAVRVEVGEAKEKVDAKDLNDLVKLLVHHQAWEQRVPERPPVPDESRARLEVRVGDAAVTVWEWFNDLPKNKRLGEIRDRMMKVGLKAK
jgi:hypothetical protein